MTSKYLVVEEKACPHCKGTGSSLGTPKRGAPAEEKTAQSCGFCASTGKVVEPCDLEDALRALGVARPVRPV